MICIKNNICMFDSELFYFDIVCDVCVYINFIEIMKIIVREFYGFFICNRYNFCFLLKIF